MNACCYYILIIVFPNEQSFRQRPTRQRMICDSDKIVEELIKREVWATNRQTDRLVKCRLQQDIVVASIRGRFYNFFYKPEQIYKIILQGSSCFNWVYNLHIFYGALILVPRYVHVLNILTCTCRGMCAYYQAGGC